MTRWRDSWTFPSVSDLVKCKGIQPRKHPFGFYSNNDENKNMKLCLFNQKICLHSYYSFLSGVQNLSSPFSSIFVMTSQR